MACGNQVMGVAAMLPALTGLGLHLLQHGAGPLRGEDELSWDPCHGFTPIDLVGDHYAAHGS